jgi:hypothetical protein
MDTMDRLTPDLLFSVNTYIAYKIAEKYYNGIHYAWFTTKFDSGTNQPASSNPRSICTNLLEAIASRDRNCEKIIRIKINILKGAYEKHKNKVINDQQELQIRGAVEQAGIDMFMPIIYVANYGRIKKYCSDVQKSERASDTSIEFLSRELPREEFDIIDMKKTLGGIYCFSLEGF